MANNPRRGFSHKEPSAGKSRFWIRRNHADGPIEIPAGLIIGEEPGPVFSLIAGVHGAEYAPIAAAQELFRRLDTKEVKGQVRFVFIANLPGYRTRSMFVNPTDGKNLNGAFPGDEKGSHTEALAWTIFEEVIKGSHYLVDLHSGDMIEDLVPFVIVKTEGDPKQDQRRLELAGCYPTGYLLNPKPNAAGWNSDGATFACAQASGAISCMVEAGGKGQLDLECVEFLVQGTLAALRWAGNLDAGFPPVDGISRAAMDGARQSGSLDAHGSTRPGQREIAELRKVFADNPGLFIPMVKAGQTVRAGDPLGTVYDFFGNLVETPLAPKDGVVLLVCSGPAVEPGTALAGIGVFA